MGQLPDIQGGPFLSVEWNPMPVTGWGGIELWFLAGLLFYAWVFQQNIREIRYLFRFLFDFRDFSKPFRDSSGSVRFSKAKNFYFFLLNLFAGSGMLYMAADRGLIGLNEDIFGDYLAGTGDLGILSICFLCILAFYTVKRLLLSVVSEVFEERKFGLFVWRTGLYYDWVYSLVAFPVLAVFLQIQTPVFDTVFWILLVVFAILLILKVLKTVLIGASYTRFSLLHIFCYLCGLEILPFLCLWQLFFGF